MKLQPFREHVAQQPGWSFHLSGLRPVPETAFPEGRATEFARRRDRPVGRRDSEPFDSVAQPP